MNHESVLHLIARKDPYAAARLARVSRAGRSAAQRPVAQYRSAAARVGRAWATRAASRLAFVDATRLKQMLSEWLDADVSGAYVKWDGTPPRRPSTQYLFGAGQQRNIAQSLRAHYARDPQRLLKWINQGWTLVLSIGGGDTVQFKQGGRVGVYQVRYSDPGGKRANFPR